MVLCVALVSVLPAPVLAQDSQVWSEWESIKSVRDRSLAAMEEVRAIARNLVERLFSQARDLVRSGAIRQVLDILEFFAMIAAALGDRFAWVYQQALQDLRRLLAGDPNTALSGAWFARNSDRTADVLGRSFEQRAQSASSSMTGDTGANESAKMAAVVSSREDLSEGARITWNAGEELARQATDIPSTRAGVQALIAGQAAALKGQAVEIRGLGERINVLAAQNSMVASQLYGVSQNLKQIAESEQRRQEQEEVSTQQTAEIIEGTAGDGIDQVVSLMLNTLVGSSGYTPFSRR